MGGGLRFARVAVFARRLQAAAALASSWYFPACQQVVHPVFPLALAPAWVPTGQYLQAMPPLTDPSLTSSYCPWEHGVQALRPVTPATFPLAQKLHESLPVPAWNFPVAQAAQLVAPLV